MNPILPNRFGNPLLVTCSAINESHLERVEVGDGKLIVTWRLPSNSTYLVSPPRPKPDYVWREVWEMKEGELAYRGYQEGKHIPESLIPESFSFSDEVITPETIPSSRLS